MSETRKPRGRPPSPDSRDTVIRVRLKSADLSRIREAAERRGLDASTFVRSAAIAECERVERRK